MRFDTLLSERKKEIVSKWFDAVVATYPADTARFLKRQPDRFANPVGRTIAEGLGALFDVLLGESIPESAASLLDPIIRIRAVQSFSASQATAFILLLKQIVEEGLAKEVKEGGMIDGLLNFEKKVDILCLLAFDVYMRCREKVYEIRVNEERNRTFRAFKRAGLIAELPDDKPDLP